MTSDNLEDFSLIWLDAHLDEDPDRRIRLRGIINYLKYFKTSDECIQHVTSTKNEKIFLIVSGSFGESVVPIIHDLSQIAYIYIYCLHEDFHKQWTKSYTKIHGVFTETSDLFLQLTADVMSYNKTLPPPMTVCSFSGMREQSVQDLDKESVTFLWFHMLLQILLRLPDSTTIDARKEMLAECRAHYYDNKIELEKIKEFEDTYSCENALQWYTRDSFLYRLINRAFRTENIDIIFQFRFFVSYLFNQMFNIHNQTSITSELLTVYRGQTMSNNELKNIGHLISINTFCSTTTSCEVALAFAGECNQHSSIESVVFQIDINTNLVRNPFVNLTGQSKYTDEKEILLSMGFIYRIDSVEQLLSGHWFVLLTATNEEDTKTKELLNYLKKEIGETSILLQLGEFLGTMGEYDKSRRYYEILLNQLPENHRNRAEVYNNLGVICIYTGDWISAANYLEEGLKLDLIHLKSDDPYLAITYKNIGVVYYNRGIYEKAIDNYTKALNIELISLPETNSAVGTTYNNMGMVYTDRGDYQQANEHLEKALEYKLLSLPKNHPNLANTYNNIGLLHLDNCQYDKALENLEKAREIYLICLPEHHSTTATTLNNIGLIYQKRGDQVKALDYFEKELANIQKSLPAGHIDFARTYNNLGLVEYEMKHWGKVIEFYENAATIYRQTHGSEHPSLASIFYNLGNVYNNGKHDWIIALGYYEKALAIAAKMFSSTHKDIELYQPMSL